MACKPPAVNSVRAMQMLRHQDRGTAAAAGINAARGPAVTSDAMELASGLRGPVTGGTAQKGFCYCLNSYQRLLDKRYSRF